MDDSQLASKLERQSCARVAAVMRSWPRVA